jgi:hypothetical protein
MDSLDALTERLKELIDLATDGLIADLGSSAEYQEIMSELLVRYHTAAYLVGAGTDTVSDAARAKITGGVASQLAFLERFVTEIQGAEEFEAGWQARARSYAESVKVPYWTGRTKVLPLPALPGEAFSTQCGQACRCSWEIRTIDAEKGDYDAYWIYGKAEIHCQSCIERENTWNPLRIRDGELQL